MTLPTLTERLDREAPWFGDLPKAAARIRDLEAALKPFADAVYNDNGDMAIIPCGTDEYAKAYFVMRRLARGDGQSKPE